MNKKKIIILLVLFILLALIVTAVWLNWDTIIMVKDGLTTSQEVLEERKAENEVNQQEALKEAGIENIRPLTEEETKALETGEITEDEAVEIVIGNTTIEEIKDNKKNTSNSSKPSSNQTSQSKPVSTAPAVSELDKANARISQLIGQMYVLKSKFTGELSGLEGWAISTYKNNPSDKSKILKEGYNRVVSLESQCDSQVNAILSELTQLLKQTGQSTELVNQIRNAYENEKQITKSYYLSKYK